MKIAVLSNEAGMGRNFVYTNLVEVLEDSKSMECISEQEHGKALEVAEYCVLVSGSTEDSLEALKTLINQVEDKGIAYGVLINKSVDMNNIVSTYCKQNQVTKLLDIPYSDLILKSSEENKIISCINEDYRMQFLTVLNNIYIHMANMIFKVKNEGEGGCGGH